MYATGQLLTATETREGAQVVPLAPAVFAAAYADRVHRFAAMVSRNDPDSEDLAQEALVRALRALPRFDPRRGSLDAWVWRIVVHTAKDAGRAARRRRLLAERWIQARSGEQMAASIEVDALNRIRDIELLALVRSLPKRPRTVIALRFGAQLKTSEVAAQLGMKPSAVSMATKRALSSLRKQLEKNNGDHD